MTQSLAEMLSAVDVVDLTQPLSEDTPSSSFRRRSPTRRAWRGTRSAATTTAGRLGVVRATCGARSAPMPTAATRSAP